MSLPQFNNFFENIIFPISTQEQKQDCENKISRKKVIDALKSFTNNKNSIRQTKINKKLNYFTKASCYKVNEKNDKDERFVKNWRPVSLLNIDYKIIPKVFPTRLKRYFRC